MLMRLANGDLVSRMSRAANRDVQIGHQMTGLSQCEGPGGCADWDLPPGVTLRLVEIGDQRLAADLYLASMRRNLIPLGMWDDTRAEARFRRVFKREQSRVICRDGHDIGWLQISASRQRIRLHQIHIIERFRNQGIGAALIGALLRHAGRTRMTVALNVVRGNPALSLYLRLGFHVTGGDEEKFYMELVSGPR